VTAHDAYRCIKGISVNRRNLLKGALIGASALALRPSFALAAAADDAKAQLAAIERKHGGRLGVAMLDTGSGERVDHRADERFLLCSTFKMLLAAAVLARVDHGQEKLDRRLLFAKEALLEHAPVTKLHVGPPGMTLAELCQAASPSATTRLPTCCWRIWVGLP
jgi:beta-lactamase class A